MKFFCGLHVPCESFSMNIPCHERYSIQRGLDGIPRETRYGRWVVISSLALTWTFVSHAASQGDVSAKLAAFKVVTSSYHTGETVVLFKPRTPRREIAA